MLSAATGFCCKRVRPLVWCAPYIRMLRLDDCFIVSCTQLDPGRATSLYAGHSLLNSQAGTFRLGMPIEVLYCCLRPPIQMHTHSMHPSPYSNAHSFNASIPLFKCTHIRCILPHIQMHTHSMHPSPYSNAHTFDASFPLFKCTHIQCILPHIQMHTHSMHNWSWAHPQRMHTPAPQLLPAPSNAHR